jgi:uncharacterized protein YbcI
MAANDEGGVASGGQAADVTNAIVAIFRNHYGRGPIKAKTFLMDDYVLTVLHETMTTAERTLAESGGEALVREFRLGFQTVMADEFKGAVAGIVGRKVLSYQSQIAFNPEVCFEFFWLEPAPDDDGG